MKYYKADFIEGVDLDAEAPYRAEPHKPLMWAEIVRVDDGWVLRYRSSQNMDIPAKDVECMRKPRFVSDGFFVEVKQANKVAMLRFTEYHGKKESWAMGSGTAFKRVVEK